MSFTAKQWKAINWYAHEMKLLPQMSVKPKVTFLNSLTQKYEDIRLDSLEIAYEGHLAGEKRAKMEARKKEKAALRAKA